MQFVEGTGEISNCEALCSKLQEMHLKFGYDCEAICNAWYSDIFGTAELNEIKNKKLITIANVVRNAVKGESDYRGEFARLGHLLSLGIMNGSVDCALSCVKACETMYDTHEVEEFYSEEWAIATITRIISCTHLDVTTIAINDIMIGCKMLTLLYESGDKYEHLVKSNELLQQTLAAAMAYIENNNIMNQCKLNKKQFNQLKKEVSLAQGLCSTGETKLRLLENSIDMQDIKLKAVGNVLFNAYNSMCEERPEDLDIQVLAAQGNLMKAAIYILAHYTEATESSSFLEACVFIKLLITPWNRTDALHMQKKLIIANILKEMNIYELLTKQFDFWWIQWNGSYGDCYDPCIIILKEYLCYFPENKELVLNNNSIISLIKRAADYKRSYYTNHPWLNNTQTYECGGSASIYLENVLGISEQNMNIPVVKEGVV